ncbi:MAG: acetyl-CoA carboxylase carboxyltransferase subunit beta [Solirubrobacterales bacterium]|nr:acetyl-CoA carboxylase carboxyltransferase subunit beta [Solirubrobacterales bacterium]MBV9715629.1 acetyl-CoA carboxylase carboxyltransferase subunit beta [Solirubrobacterales bacterium]
MADLATTATRAVSTEWFRCPACQAFVYHKRLKRNLGVCPECNHHFRLKLSERLAQLLDTDSFEERSGDLEPLDALSFVDSKPYTDRIRDAQRKTGLRAGAVYGTGTIDSLPVVVAAIDFAFIGGSMSGAVGEAITRAAELALETRTPLLVISASGGARMQEGCISLMQMAKTTQAVARLAEEGVLFMSLLTDPTYGGVSASYATLGDVLISEPGAHIGFAGPTVIEQTIREQLPDGFQTAEFLLEHGMLDIVEPRENLRRTIRNLLDLHAAAEAARQNRDGGTAAQLPSPEGAAPVTDPAQITVREPWEVVQLARHIDRPRMLDLVGFTFDEFHELRGDRLFGEDAAIVGGLARLGELTVMVLGQQKGHTTSELMEHNFGMPEPEGYRKGMRLMRYAARFKLPLVTLVDTPGAYPGLGAEQRGQSVAISESIMLMSRLPVPIVTVVTGEGGSGGALALATSDRVLMMENAYYSVISPEGCSTILFKDASAAPRAAKVLRITSPELLALGVMDAIVPEPPEGAQTDPAASGANLRAAIIASLARLLQLHREELLAQRYERFRKFGAPGLQPVLPPITGET